MEKRVIFIAISDREGLEFYEAYLWVIIYSGVYDMLNREDAGVSS